MWGGGAVVKPLKAHVLRWYLILLLFYFDKFVGIVVGLVFIIIIYFILRTPLSIGSPWLCLLRFLSYAFCFLFSK
jgi:hypothetical protein